MIVDYIFINPLSRGFFLTIENLNLDFYPQMSYNTS
jgi:hypothetical protein